MFSLRPASRRILSPRFRFRHYSSSTSTFPRTISSLLYSSPSDGKTNETVTVTGWVRSVRRMKNVSFAHVSDGSTIHPVQAVLTKEQSENLSMGASVKIMGEWKESIGGKRQQSRELLAEKVELLGKADPLTYPLQKKYQTPEFLRTLSHLRPRIPANTNLLRLRSNLISTLTAFFAEHSFIQCHTPIITPSDCEGAGEVFTITRPENFFKTPKYLTVSSQLHLEALAAAVPRVWTLSPTFRAEKSDTARHLSEFYMLEVEAAFIDSLDPLIALIEAMVKTLVRSISTSRLGEETLSTVGGEDKAKELEERWNSLLERPWSRITYTEAISRLSSAVEQKEVQFAFPPVWGAALQAEHERFLAQTVFNGPVFVTDYPKSLKPFYMLPSTSTTPTPEGGETVACFDLLVPVVGELIGGSLREHRYDELLAEMQKHGMVLGDGDEDEGSLRWYLELRKWGSVKHGGFGLGFDRLVCYLAGVENIREAVAFPRWVGRCDC
ncbi:asparaginyl-tRNA synthetase [Choiromyces venosus 120613-1]|uniref:asparagine--tRNA ligase n=1 Tax=Choiromyces venosus 120613-1 TaxID=1336337 RepID=A0A3N4JMW6_9PEZI|nr:asparaginyl-tRNA synthetase [Choiromyces venosus 120613-1]